MFTNHTFKGILTLDITKPVVPGKDVIFPDNSILNFTSVKPIVRETNPKTKTHSSCGNCVFPFIMFGRIHDRCTTIVGTAPLCSTTSNYDQDGLWEFCTDSTCPGVAPPTESMTVSPGNEVGSCCKYYILLIIIRILLT